MFYQKFKSFRFKIECGLDLKLRFIIFSSQMDQPQPCTKCKKLPEDILMLACSHDLCLDCASERLAFEMKKKKGANVPTHILRASSARSATKGPPLMLKAWPSLKDLSQRIRLQSHDHTQSLGHPLNGLKEWCKNRKCRRAMRDPRTGHTSDSPCASTPPSPTTKTQR